MSLSQRRGQAKAAASKVSMGGRKIVNPAVSTLPVPETLPEKMAQEQVAIEGKSKLAATPNCGCPQPVQEEQKPKVVRSIVKRPDRGGVVGKRPEVQVDARRKVVTPATKKAVAPIAKKVVPQNIKKRPNKSKTETPDESLPEEEGRNDDCSSESDSDDDCECDDKHHHHCPPKRKCRDRSASKGQVDPEDDALVSAARMVLEDVDDSYSPLIPGLLEAADDPITAGGVLVEGDAVGFAGRLVEWYDDNSFVALNQLAIFAFQETLQEDIPIPLWSYYEVNDGGSTGPDGSDMVLTQSGPAVGFNGFPAGEVTNVGPAFFDHKIIAVTRSVGSQEDPGPQYAAIELYRSDTGVLTDRLVLSGTGADPGVEDIIVLESGFQSAGPISNDDLWLGYGFQKGSFPPVVPNPDGPDTQPPAILTDYVLGFLRVDPVTGTFLVPTTGLPPGPTDALVDPDFQIAFSDPEGDLGIGPTFVNHLGGGIYQLIISESVFAPNPSRPGAGTTLSTGTFDSNTGEIVFFSDEQVEATPGIDPNPRLFVPESVIGSDISDDGKNLVIGLREVAPPRVFGCVPGTPPGNTCGGPLSVFKQAAVRVDNPLIPNTQAELRYYRIDQDTPTGPQLEFVSAVEIGARINFVALSHEEKCLKVAIGTRAYVSQTVLGACPGDPRETVPFSNPYIQVLIFTFDTRTGKFFLQDTKPVAVATFGAGFNDDNTLLATHGRPSLVQYGDSLWSIHNQH